MAKFFGDLRRRLEKFRQLDADRMAFDLAKTGNFQDLVVELNTEDQLFNKGEDSTGTKLSDIGGDYSPITLKISEDEGRPKKSKSDINLHDTGAFYNSFIVRPFLGGFEINADLIKDGESLADDWGENIIGLNEQNLDRIRDEHKEFFQKEIKKI